MSLGFSRDIILRNNADIPTVLKIPKFLFKEIIGLIKMRYPVEACGVLLGKVKGSTAEVNRVKELMNLLGSSTGFWFDVKEWMKVILEGKELGLDYIGIFHSHNRNEPKPSPQDMERMVECPGEIWLILSFKPRGAYKVAAWSIAGYDLATRSIRVKVV